MVNWHRKIWTLIPQRQGGLPSDPRLFRQGGASNQFWFEPYADAQGQLRFAVMFKEGAMTDVWKNRIMIAKGDNEFAHGVSQTGDVNVERLESLPFPFANGGGAPANHVIKVFAGEHPEDPSRFYLHAEMSPVGGGGGGIVGAGQSGKP